MNTFDEVKAKFTKDVLDKYDFSAARYTGALNRITGVICPDHGEFSQYSVQFRKGRGCPKCGENIRADKKRMPEKDFIAECQMRHKDKQYDYSKTKYSNMSSKIKVQCAKHGEFSITALKHYYSYQGCGKCEQEAKKTRIVKYRHLSAQSKIHNTGKTFFEECTKSHGGKYIYPEQEYLGAKTLITAICARHGKFKQSAWKHLNGGGCPVCGQFASHQEIAIKDYIESLGFIVETRNRKILAPKEIDIWVPERGIGIEYHGLYWHTEDKVGDSHRTKWTMAQAAGIRLIQIFEDEWLNKQEVVKSRIDALLGRCSSIYARKTSIINLEAKEAADFMDRYHIQGKSNSSVAYGLTLNEKLMAVATFGRARGGAMTASGHDSWEVYRYASIGRVVGGFSKLFKHFLKNHNPEKVISYCDLRYGNGKVYEKSGFVLDSISEPDYWWVPKDKNVRVARYRTQKHKLSQFKELAHTYSPDKSEKQICEDAGWRKIFGVGNQKWVYYTVDRTNKIE